MVLQEKKRLDAISYVDYHKKETIILQQTSISNINTSSPLIEKNADFHKQKTFDYIVSLAK